MDQNLIPLLTGFSILTGLVITGLISSTPKEKFDSVPIPSSNSMPRNQEPRESGLPLFLNFHKGYGGDFKLQDFIQHLKLNNQHTIWNGLYTKGGHTRDLFETKKLPPIIIVPGLGASPLYAIWNKNTSENVKNVDESGNFEKSDIWSCKQVQTTWESIWPPKVDGLESYCWANNAKVVVTDNASTVLANPPGVQTTTKEFGSLDFLPANYMSTLITALESVGYKKGENLFGAMYDFRKITNKEEIEAWSLSMTKLIERSTRLQGHRAIILGHDLGSVIANHFLVGAIPKWKKQYIKSFVTVSGAFGGCPKALREILSGADLQRSQNENNFNKTIRNYGGLALMLPNPHIYGDNALVHYNSVTYTSYDIPTLIQKVSPETAKAFNSIMAFRDTSMKAPGVTVYSVCGDDLRTESSYKYEMSLINDPKINAPFYRMDLPMNQKFHYTDEFVGDGTMPRFALEFPILWSKDQQEPVFFQFFVSTEHTKILSMYDPVRYIMSIIED